MYKDKDRKNIMSIRTKASPNNIINYEYKLFFVVVLCGYIFSLV